ncbi:MAG: hypothetical protein ACI81R_001847 [Bradymonadia bacterium]|jgi:hypothetical protein
MATSPVPIIERPAQTAENALSDSSNWSVLPTELRGVQSHRIAQAALLYAALYGCVLIAGILMRTFIGLPDVAPSWLSNEAFALALARPPVQWIAIGVSLAVALLIFAFARSGKLDERMCGVSMGLQVDGALGIALAEQWIRPLLVPDDSFAGVSWVAIWVLLYPMLVPTVPKRALVGSLLAATTGPVAMWVSYWSFGETPSGLNMVIAHFPNYIAAGVGYAASRFVFTLGKRASSARRLGSYELTERIGAGGMGEVWRANHALLKRPAAVKLVRPERLAGTGFDDPGTMIKRFELEAQATALLQSPHTITLYDYGVSADGTFYYVMELLDGFDLETLVERFGPLPPERVGRFVMEIASSLAEAHQRGLIHRDIKPANLFTTRQGIDVDFMKVLDFGLVKSTANHQQNNRLTMDGVASGTPAYMAPEVALGESNIDGKADIYGLGAVAYWLLTGRLVFEAESPMKMVMKHVNEEPIAPSTLSEFDVPPELDELVLRCLAKRPEDRPSAMEIRNMLCEHRMRQRWSEDRARRWWAQNAPDMMAAE